ncbi:MAG: Mrp/NBP35 family ATP-binding protein [Thermodesulfobacteriota bacterium]|nr:Mrp/NBP35 family ATP-binding protein [Thermodesulfobacteriota bacterium]
MSQDKCVNDSTCDTCNQKNGCSQEEKEEHSERLLRETLLKIGHKFMVMSGKGGVGKTTVAVNLAATLAKDGFKVGLLDADIHGPNVPKMLGLEMKKLEGSEKKIKPVSFSPNLKVISMALLLDDPDRPIVWRGPLKHGAFKQFLSEVDWGNLDYLLVDLPPGTGDEPLSIAQLINNVDGSIIVTTPQDVALLDSRKAVRFSRLLNIPIVGIIENMSGFSCSHCGKSIDLFKIGGGEKAALELNVPFLARIVIDPDIVQNSDRGLPFVEVLPDSKAAKSFREIGKKCEEFVDKIENKSEQVNEGHFGISKVKDILARR